MELILMTKQQSKIDKFIMSDEEYYKINLKRKLTQLYKNQI